MREIEEVEKELKEIGERLNISKSKLKTPKVELPEVPEVKVQDVIEEVQEKVEEIQDAVEKVIESKGEELTKTVVRTVEELPKTFQCCLPFLSKFWVNEKQK